MKTTPKRTIGVVLGRYQLSALHEGHEAVIAEVQKRHEEVIIVIAVAPLLFNRKNPLPGSIRQKLIQKRFEGQKVTVVTLANNISDQQWSKNFDELLKKTADDADFIIYGARDNSLKYYSGEFKTAALNLDLPTSATMLRQNLAGNIPEEAEALRHFSNGIIHATAHIFPTSYFAVDLAVTRECADEVEALICFKKKYDKWYFCGGFVDPNDKTILDAVKREKAEELGIDLEVDSYQFLGDFLIDDWRFRGTEHSIRSMFYVGTRLWGKEKAGDDIDDTKWVNVSDLVNVIAEEHLPLAERLIAHLKERKNPNN